MGSRSEPDRAEVLANLRAELRDLCEMTDTELANELIRRLEDPEARHWLVVLIIARQLRHHGEDIRRLCWEIRAAYAPPDA